MRRLPELKGNLVPLVTPFHSDGGVDREGFAKLARKFLANPHIDGLFALGATGEFPSLDQRERLLLIESLPEQNGKAVTVNLGGLAMPLQVELAGLCGRRVTAVATTLPREVPCTPEAVAEFLKPLAETGVPFTVYWTPFVKEHAPSATIVERLLTEYPSFAGLKDSSRNMVAFSDLALRFGGEISVFQGVEMLQLLSLAAGAAGMVGGGLNLYPRHAHELAAAFECGDLETARRCQMRLDASWARLEPTGGFRSIAKRYWQEKGVLTGGFCRMGNNLQFTEQEFQCFRELAAL